MKSDWCRMDNKDNLLGIKKVTLTVCPIQKYYLSHATYNFHLKILDLNIFDTKLPFVFIQHLDITITKNN